MPGHAGMFKDKSYPDPTRKGLSLKGTTWRSAEMRVEGKGTLENWGDKSGNTKSIKEGQEFRL